jgi:hypothetical protein
MKTLVPLRIATAGIITILSLSIIFHLLVISGIIPFNLVWGGNIADKGELWLMESISIAVNLIMLLFVGSYSGVISYKISPTVARTGFWMMFILFLLNTLGNILSTNPLETYIFTPLTILLSLFCLRIATHSPLKK